MGFSLQEDTKLEGSFEIIVLSEKPLLLNSPTVLLKYKHKQCVAVIRSVNPGPNQILIDRFIKDYLQDTEKDFQIEIESVEVPLAETVEINIPSEWIGSIGRERAVKDKLLNKPISEGMETYIHTLDGPKPIAISKVIPSPFAVLVEDTIIDFKTLEKAKEDTIGVRWTDIGGLGKANEKIRELIEYPMRFPEIVTYIGIEPPKGILLYGPPGTGKTLIAKALSNELNANFHSIQGPEIMSAYYGESEKKLREIFEKASKEATIRKPYIILIDEVDSISPKRDAVKGGLESTLVATFLTLMDGLKETKGIIIIGTTNRPNAIDPALRRPGRFEYEIYIGIPDAQGRKEILDIHTKKMPLADDLDINDFAEKTHGFVGADISFLCREAGRNAFRRIYLRNEEAAVNEVGKKETKLIDLSHRPEEVYSPPSLNVKVTRADFEMALSSIAPSGMREVLIQMPRDVSWQKIGGLKEIKRIIEENIVKGIKFPEVFKEMGIRPARGILLYGPPGTGKTLIAKAIANECGANFISIKGPELRSKWFGESEEKIRFIFDISRKYAPCVIFFDEVDALTPARGSDVTGSTDSIVNQFLAEMDGVQSTEGVFVIGATNRKELIDEALLRPGRFDYKVYIPLPDSEAREEIFKIHLKKEVLANDLDIDAFVEKTDNYSGAEICDVCRLAGLKALREVNFEKTNLIRTEHILASIDEVLQNKNREKSVGFNMAR